MTVLDQFENAANEVQGLLAALTSSTGQNATPAISPEWMQQAQKTLMSSSVFLNEPSLESLKSASQIQRYRSELFRLKAAIEDGQKQLAAQCSVIRAEQMRLKRLKALTNTLGKLG
jgi:prophage DNA circulation protein